MKNLRTKIIITVFTFLIGISAAIWFYKFKPDLTVYSTNFCELIKEPHRYDGKIIELKTSYKQGFEASFLTDYDCEDSITATCSLDKESCDKIFDSLLESAESNQVNI